MRLLLAEDESTMAEAIMAYLEYHGHQADWAENGFSAARPTNTTARFLTS